jgi:thiamine biosynthesis lipoprotein
VPSKKLLLLPKPNTDLPTTVSEWSFEAIGTAWWIGIYSRLADSSLQQLQKLVAARIETFDLTYSRFRPDSVVTKISKVAGTYQLPADSKLLFDMYRKLYDATDGLVTPLIGQVLSNAGYDANYSLRPGTLSTPPSWDSMLSFNDGQLTTTEPVLLDFGAAGKGYLVDIIAELLQAHGVTLFCVDAGGDMLCRGLGEPLQIGLENPVNSDELLGTVALQEGAICGSASNRRKWSGYHHIMNPQSLRPVDDIRAAWVTAPTALVADGLATALFFVPPEKLTNDFTYSYCIVRADNGLVCASDFPGKLFTTAEEPN